MVAFTAVCTVTKLDKIFNISCESNKRSLGSNDGVACRSMRTASANSSTSSGLFEKASH